ncbi:MAG: chorismate mutase [Burkholderiales bacterium]|nr:chorismate mutase [Burkholderiales bacterium]
MIEPDPAAGPVRRFRDASYRPRAANLAEIRSQIDRIDAAIIALLAERASYVKDATRFKRDAFQVSAPARQAQVFARVRELAHRANPGFEGFDDVVEATYRTLVASFVAGEGRHFDATEPL